MFLIVPYFWCFTNNWMTSLKQLSHRLPIIMTSKSLCLLQYVTVYRKITRHFHETDG